MTSTVTLSYSSDTYVLTVALSSSPVTVHVQQARDAYQLAVAEGFSGTREEWLASLAGPPGPVGTGLEWVTLTTDDFEALATKDPDTIYDLSDVLP